MFKTNFALSPSKIFLLSFTIVVFGLMVYLSGSFASATICSLLYAYFAIAD